MGSSKEYRAVKNFFHNTEKIDRHEIKLILREVIKEVVAEEIDRLIGTWAFRSEIHHCIKGKEFQIQQAVAREILTNFEITVKQKDAKP